MLEIRFNGRGGQGVVVASRILGLSFFKAGMYPQCYSVFGGERRGAPVVSYLRVDSERILLKCEIKRPNALIYLDESLFDPQDVRVLLDPGSPVLLNSPHPSDFGGLLAGLRVGRVDAGAIAEAEGLGTNINTAVLGAYCRLAGQPAPEHLLEAIAETIPAKTEANLAAARRAFQDLEIREPN